VRWPGYGCKGVHPPGSRSCTGSRRADPRATGTTEPTFHAGPNRGAPALSPQRWIGLPHPRKWHGSLARQVQSTGRVVQLAASNIASRDAEHSGLACSDKSRTTLDREAAVLLRRARGREAARSSVCGPRRAVPRALLSTGARLISQPLARLNVAARMLSGCAETLEKHFGEAFAAHNGSSDVVPASHSCGIRPRVHTPSEPRKRQDQHTNF